MANEHSNIIPNMSPTSTVADFKFWCQKVLPLVYDDSISYYEVLGKMVVYLNQVIDNINATTDNVEELEDDFLLLQTYVNNFFDDIDQLASYAERAEAAETSAISYAASAAESASNASTSSLAAMDAKDAAVAAKTAAETALANAQTAATNAAASATAAGNSATAAAGSATAASGSATNAAASATAAQNSFSLADAARTAAQSAATSAENDAEDAADSAAEAVAAVDTIINGLGNITKTIENAPIATTEDALASITKKLAVDIEPVQSGVGDPSPTNVRTIAGWTGANVTRTGKNLLPDKFYRSIQYNASIGTILNHTVMPETDYTKSGNTYTCEVGGWGSFSMISHLLKAGTYKVNVAYEATSPRSSIYATNKDFKVLASQNATVNQTWTNKITLTEDGYIVIYCASSSAGTVKYTAPQIEIGEANTGYEEYTGITIPIAFPVAAGTVYGGTLTNEGSDEWKLKVDRTIRNANTITWDSTTIEGTKVFCCAYAPSKQEGKREILCSHFKPVVSQYFEPSPDLTITNAWARYANINIRYDALTTLEEWNAFITANDVLICWYLDTPIEYTISESQVITLLNGINNVFADTGNINILEYFTNAENYVTSQIDLAKALIAPVLKDMKADTALVANDFRIIGNTLYRITGNISSGGTLTPNTNCVATTVGEILKSILSA